MAVASNCNILLDPFGPGIPTSPQSSDPSDYDYCGFISWILDISVFLTLQYLVGSGHYSKVTVALSELDRIAAIYSHYSAMYYILIAYDLCYFMT